MNINNIKRYRFHFGLLVLALGALFFVFDRRSGNAPSSGFPLGSAEVVEVSEESGNPELDVTSLKELKEESPEVKEQSFEELLEEVNEKISSFPPGTPYFDGYVDRLIMALTLDSAPMEEAVLRILEGDLRVYAQWALVEAIAKQPDVIKGHSLLRGLVENSEVGNYLKVTVLSLFPFAENPPRETIDLLVSLGRDSVSLNGSAMNALGRIALNVEKFDSELYSQITTQLADRLDAGLYSHSDDKVFAALKALGRARDQASEARAIQLLNDSHAKVREGALTFLALFNYQKGAPTILNAVENGAHPVDRQAALRALKQGLPGLRMKSPRERKDVLEGIIDSLTRHARVETDSEVQKSILDYFHRALGNPTEGVVDLLNHLASAGNTSSIRGKAQWHLKYGCGVRTN